MAQPTDKPKISCPVCGKSDEVIPIVYGFPTNKTFEAAEKGKVRLGGCLLEDKASQYYCKRDEVAF